MVRRCPEPPDARSCSVLARCGEQKRRFAGGTQIAWRGVVGCDAKANRSARAGDPLRIRSTIEDGRHADGGTIKYGSMKELYPRRVSAGRQAGTNFFAKRFKRSLHGM